MSNRSSIDQYRMTIVRNLQRQAKEIRNAQQLLQQAVVKLQTDPDLDPITGGVQDLIDQVQAALRR